MIILLLAMVFLAITACTDSEDLLYNSEDAVFIEVDAVMASSFDSTENNVKEDTIHPGDSVIFMARILPSKSIRMKNYYWTIDDKYLSGDFSFREAIFEPGLHQIVFVLVDFFKDTLSDTLKLWVSSNPEIDYKDFIPRDFSQGVNPLEPLSFAWNSHDPDSLASLHFHFTLTEKKGDGTPAKILDTNITSPSFVYPKAFSPLSQYFWSVYAINEFGYASTDTIQGNFFTKGMDNAGGISGTVKLSDQGKVAKVEYSILDSNNNYIAKAQKTKCCGFSEVDIVYSPIEEGNYKLLIYSPNQSDFKPDTLSFKINPNQFFLFDTLSLRDTIPPSIKSTTENGSFFYGDTLFYRDTLSFIIRDNNGSITSRQYNVYLEGSECTSTTSLSNDTLYVRLHNKIQTWTHRLLTIKATDFSGNSYSKNFFIRPNTYWIKTNSDTTIAENGFAHLWVEDRNPFGFTPEYFTFFLESNDGSSITVAANGSQHQQEVSASQFKDFEQKVIIQVQYTNGIQNQTYFTLSKNHAPTMEYDNCIEPCQIVIDTTAHFMWHPATDMDSKNLEYRMVYTLGVGNTSDTSLYVYASEFSSDTTLELEHLPEGYLNWWIEARDDYGNISPKWQKPALVWVIGGTDHE
ncbi:MAG: hypothetical protein HUK21_03365 [Fibrobacteraceae bacterium]|nr:hypothetical protein [Fibrobacteraceae bacterium]